MNEKPTENPSLASLTAQLEALKSSQVEAAPAAPSSNAARAATDFASAAMVGLALGFGVDYLLHSSPWGLITGLILGVVAGFRIMLRATAPNADTSTPAPSGEK